jgi:hypothetical protein
MAFCGRGGIGRRASLRSWWVKARGGSSPLDRTKFAKSGYSKHRRAKREVSQARRMEELSRIDYEDTFLVNCPAGISTTNVLLGFFNSTPKIVRILMAFRNGIVSILGLKTNGHISQLDASKIKTGGRIGLFELGSITPQSAVVGADDRHLNFRVLFEIENIVLSCKTQVKFNNSLGRIYFFFVKPFHRSIVPLMLKASVKSLEKP